MKMQQILRQENFQLKNQISDMKNAFDLNRDILKMLTNYNQNADPHMKVFMQIITRLTTVNNQAMISSIDLIQQKHILKQENMRLNIALDQLEKKLQKQIESNKICNLPNQSKFLMQEQFNSLNKELMAANQQRIAKQQEIEHWKQKYIDCLSTIQNKIHINGNHKKQHQLKKINRKYTSNESLQYQIQNEQLKKEIRKLKYHIEELQYRLTIFIKAYKLEQQLIQRERHPERQYQFYQNERQEIRLLKYALNDIQIVRKEDQYIFTVTQRFRNIMNPRNNTQQENRSSSWPKNKQKIDFDKDTEQQSYEHRMQERYQNQRR